ALEMPSDRARAAFLGEACDQNLDLRRHLERLLAARPRAAGAPSACRCLLGQGPNGAIRPARTFFFDITDRVLAEQERARLQEQNRYLQEEIKAAHNFEQIVGRSAALRAVLALVARVAPTDASVLITGETGTGKELIARAIHSASPRRDRPLIKVNC